eukprot:COSAG03_NODE_5406_length_1257_cov_1.292746_2_plen_89_part_00
MLRTMYMRYFDKYLTMYMRYFDKKSLCTHAICMATRSRRAQGHTLHPLKGQGLHAAARWVPGAAGWSAAVFYMVEIDPLLLMIIGRNQ